MAHQVYNYVNHSEWRNTNYNLPYNKCAPNCQVQSICQQMIRALKSPIRDNDEIKERFATVLDTFFECPKGSCRPQLLRLMKRLAMDIAELPPACEAVPLPRVDGREAGFDVVAIGDLRNGFRSLTSPHRGKELKFGPHNRRNSGPSSGMSPRR